ncbi:hypothetical protein [Pseudoalteromonas sp. S16_S37]|uniref:hypothetical protein n=1 Tax=Pseudoalteromonas sp. S16_S37 TaxID=2720228 RepID=UPI00168145C2|nr:hypothetical protein [Pseudoalteromonas sp. S16_S37]MBD1582969.1 hypothetical protein [Pseudoalteromonas sp. S16_S37]
MSVEKSGNYSSFGQFEVWFTPQNSDTPQRIAVQPHTSIYAELQNATVELRAIDGFKFNQKGSIKVNYIGQQEYADHTFAQYSVPFSL